jgi:hypothetical protein
MAQTGFTPIQLYSTSTAAAAPVAGNLTNSTLGSELAINITDGKLFYKDNANAVQVIGWKTVPTTAGGTGLTTYTAGDLSYYASGTTFTKLAIGTAGQILTSTGSAPQWTTLSGVAVTTFSAGTTGFTPNSATSGAITLAGTLAVGNGGTGTATTFTAGSVVFAGTSGVYSQDNTNLFWDNTNKHLGIGTVSPGFPLTVASSTTLAAGNPSLVLQGSNNTERLQIRSATSTGGQAIIVLNSARGTITSPTVTLNGDALGYYQFGGYNNTIFVRGAWVSGFADGDWSGTNQGSFIGFSTTPNGSTTIAERLRIFASGGVSIGNTVDPGNTNLSVTGNINGLNITANGSLIVGSSGTYAAGALYSDANWGMIIRAKQASPGQAIFRFADSADTECFRVTTANDLSVTSGNLVIGTSGKGIDFSATPGTGTSELLADYEEGTWTPTISSASGVCTFVSGSGSYTKIGRMVYVNVSVTFSTDASVGTSDLTIGGLPFASTAISIFALVSTSFSLGDYGTGGANGLANIGSSGSSFTHVVRTVDISSRAAFSWGYAGYYRAS